MSAEKTVHELKIEPCWYQRILDGTKTAELRLNDRDDQVGDWLHLRELDTSRPRFLALSFTADPEFTGRAIFAQITHVLTEVPGLKRGYAVLSLSLVIEGTL